VVKVLCYKSDGPGSIPASVSGFLIDIISFRSHYGPGVDSASNRNEYQEYFLGGKSGRCVRLTTYDNSVPLSRYLGTLTSWNPLGPSGTVTGLFYFYTGNISIKVKLRPHSRKHCCRGKAEIVTFSKCVFAALVIKHAPDYSVLCGLSDFTIFFHTISQTVKY